MRGQTVSHVIHVTLVFAVLVGLVVVSGDWRVSVRAVADTLDASAAIEAGMAAGAIGYTQALDRPYRDQLAGR